MNQALAFIKINTEDGDFVILVVDSAFYDEACQQLNQMAELYREGRYDKDLLEAIDDMMGDIPYDLLSIDHVIDL